MASPPDLTPAKASIVMEMYLHTADENYVIARWCHEQQLWTDFFWNALHALEKYMKGVLLLNGMSVKNSAHDIVKLYGAVEALAGPLLPALLTQPPGLQIGDWKDFTPRRFMEAMNRDGNADNRYSTFGYVKHIWYLAMLDLMVWHLRRLAIELDRPCAHNKPDSPSRRRILMDQPDFWFPLNLPLDKLIHGPDSPLRAAALNNNNPFAPADYPHQPGSSVISTREPILYRRIMEPLKSEIEDNARHGFQLAEWLLARTRQSKAVEQEIRAAMAAAAARHPGLLQVTGPSAP